jgi:signal transduction histidine kinase/CheY-like chemotaxis protein/ligand-binding sensor domain-containing protein/HPt (histidine-containing phosphotransfer) domain-containing protein
VTKRRLASAVAMLCCVHAVPTVAGTAPDRWQALAPAVFDHLIPAERGFPSPTTMCVVQDGDGFIWFGTQSGLGRWDGYRMRNFLFSADDANSLPGDFVQTMHVDRQGRLWIGTATGGLAMYDKQTERFMRYAAGPQGLSSPAISAIASDDKGGIWVGTAAGLDYIDTVHGNAISHHQRDPVASANPRSSQIRALLVDRDGHLWIGSNAGLARRDAVDGRVQDVAVADGVADAVLSLAGGARGEVVFGTLKSGIGLARAEGAVASARMLTLNQVKDAHTAMVLSIAEVMPGQWWAATYGGGIIEFDANGRSRRISHRPAIPTSLANDRVAAVWRDRSGLVWVANERGVDFHNPANHTVDTVLDGVGLPETSAFSFMTDARGRLWVGMGDHGIDLIAPDGSRTAGLRPDPAHLETALPNRLILAMTEAEPEEAWIGTLLGLYHTSGRGSRVTRVPLPQGEALPRIGSILRQGRLLWLGTPGGLVRYDPQAGTAQTYGQGPAVTGGLSDSRVNTLLADPDGALWVGTRNGLNRFDPASGKAEQILPEPRDATALAHGFINSLAFDGLGRLWVATNGGGISILEDHTPAGARRFRQVGMENGLPSKDIGALHTDTAGRMWASTADGLAVIDVANLRAQALGRADGLVFQPYVAGAVGQTAQSDIVFGTSGGYAIVHPEPQDRWRYQPPLVISSVRVDRHPVVAAPLLVAGGPGLRVAAGARSVEVEVAALDFSASQRNRYAFRLEGYERDWVETDANRRVATYANVPPGHYRLHMRGSNRDGVWSQHELVMELYFLPAWYQTWWARLGGGLAVLALGWGLYRWRIRQLRHTQIILQQQVYSRTLHLERVHSIVKSINDQLDFDALLHTILRASSSIGHVSAAYALIVGDHGGRLTVHASGQQEPQVRSGMTLAEAQACFVDSADSIAPDMYLSREQGLLTVRICVEQEVQGYLIFEQDRPFAGADLELFKALKEPFVSAFQKANAISAIQQARADAEASTRAKSDFLANISHEIRTPMNAILGFAGLGTHLDLPAKPREYFNKIGRAGQNLLGIIDDVLDFSKIESGKLVLEAVPFAMADLLSQIADLFSWQAAEKGLELLVWAAPEVPTHLIGDPLRLSQVLVNLVGNALKFTVRGHVVLRVELAGEPPQDDQPAQLRFVVEDSGMGIRPDQQARLFHAFSQADTSTTRLYGGTGLGLAISQQLVQAMGGVIEIDSAPDTGSRFHFSLALGCQPSLALTPTQIPTAAKGKQILVIDDCVPMGDMLERQLRSHGFAVHAVDSAAAALRLLPSQPVDLVLVDWDMPEVDGIEMARRIHGVPAHAALPVVLMVKELAREPIVQAAESAGIHSCLTKPVDPAELLDAVLVALGFERLAPPRPAPAPAVLSEAALRIAGARVLVVDDNVINQQVAREVLLRAGVQVAVAGNGVEALHLVDHDDFDAVLMDIQMPGMDGYEATARIRAKRQHARLPVIAMTAHAVAGFRENSMVKGMNDYVTKPIEPERLFAVLASWVQLDPERAAAAVPARTAQNGPLPRPGIDVPAALERLGGNTRLLKVLLEKFVEEFELSPQRLLAAIEQGAYEPAALLVHKVRGAAGNLSMPELHRAAGELELLLQSTRLGKVDAALAAFAAALETVIDGVRGLDGTADLQAAPVSQ